ncbi:hypothetical protein D0817_14510 [Flavobacterium cupreum]|uniref:Uncharacterized protein n=1 Tax=Flavobacterium cupreum TaxID=2133766 RepID=A0A434A656_9FLAO|nr:hypothetical protein [Flavobacterium cupreum]RUT69825.1 hypothetical protein D0817_14510 [Flavobacterium cupreum]
MAKVLKFKDVNSDVENRMKEFEKTRTKLKSQIAKDAAKKVAAGKEGKGLFKSLTEFFTDAPKTAGNSSVKK